MQKKKKKKKKNKQKKKKKKKIPKKKKKKKKKHTKNMIFEYEKTLFFSNWFVGLVRVHANDSNE